MKATNTFPLLFTVLIFACYVEETGKEKEYYSSPALSSSHSSSSHTIMLQDSIEYQGQSYSTIKMGSIIWFRDNLNAIPKSGKYWCHGNLPTRCEQYGKLYDWDAAMNVCPDGWKLPGETEFDSLSNFGTDVLSSNAAWWNATFGGYKDESYGNDEGFSALNEGYWWSSTTAKNNLAGYGFIVGKGGRLQYNYITKARAFSVRCVKK